MINSSKAQTRYIIIIYLVYLTTYLARLNYGAMMVELIDALGSTKAAAGLVTSFFFIAYGAGQFVNGIFTKYYNHRVIGTAAFLMSASCNIAMTLCSSVNMMKYIWMVNALSLSVLWSSVVCISGRYLDEKHVRLCLAIFGTVSAVGSALNYISCSLVIAFLPWQAAFYIGAALVILAAFGWNRGIAQLEKNCTPLTEKPSFKKDHRESLGRKKRKRPEMVFLVGFVVLLFATLIAEASVDGITTWMPNMLYEIFDMPKSYSVILTVVMPLSAVLMNFVLLAIEKKTKAFHIICSVWFGGSVAVMLVTISLFGRCGWAVMFPLMCVSRCLCASVTSIATGHMPMYYRDKIDSGLSAGLAEGFCYVGSAVSTYAFGAIADKSGWIAVLAVLAVMSAVGFVCCFTYVVYSAVAKRKKKVTAAA